MLQTNGEDNLQATAFIFSSGRHYSEYPAWVFTTQMSDCMPFMLFEYMDVTCWCCWFCRCCISGFQEPIWSSSSYTSFGQTWSPRYWIGAFLSNRTFYVKVGNSWSRECPILWGVPQGPVLGPLLFTLYVWDLSFIIQSKHVFCADDCKIFGNHLRITVTSRTIWRLSRVGVTNGSYL